MTLIYPPHPHLLFTPPRLEQFSWVNQGEATATNTRRGLTMTAPASDGNSLRLLVTSAPTPPYAVTICMFPFLPGYNYSSAGLVLRESATGKLVTFNLTGRGTGSTEYSRIHVVFWNSPTSLSTAIAVTSTPIATEYWFQIADDGTNRTMRISSDGQVWVDYYAESRTAFLTPDQGGIFLNVDRTTYGAITTFAHWSLG